MIYSIVSLFFFIMFNMKHSSDSDYFLLVPWLVFTTIMFVQVFISSTFISRGIDSFCAKVRKLGVANCENQLFQNGLALNNRFYSLFDASLLFSQALCIAIAFIDLIIFARIAFILKFYK